MPIEDVLASIDNVKKRVTMIPYNPDRAAATKEALTLAVDALEQLALVVAEIDARTRQ
jgi:hypothetical protein